MHMQQHTAAIPTSQPPTIVVIDDDASMRKALDNLLKSVGFDVELFKSPQEFLQSNRPDRPGCIVLDVRFPGRSGIYIQREISSANTSPPLLFIPCYGHIPISVPPLNTANPPLMPHPIPPPNPLPPT